MQNEKLSQMFFHEAMHTKSNRCVNPVFALNIPACLPVVFQPKQPAPEENPLVAVSAMLYAYMDMAVAKNLSDLSILVQDTETNETADELCTAAACVPRMCSRNLLFGHCHRKPRIRATRTGSGLSQHICHRRHRRHRSFQAGCSRASQTHGGQDACMCKLDYSSYSYESCEIINRGEVCVPNRNCEMLSSKICTVF